MLAKGRTTTERRGGLCALALRGALYIGQLYVLRRLEAKPVEAIALGRARWTMRRGRFGSASIFLRNFPTSTSTLRSNGSKRRLAKASSRLSRLITRPGLATNILRTANSLRASGNRVAGFASEGAGVEVENVAREAHGRCGFQRGLDTVKSRCVAHQRSSFGTLRLNYAWLQSSLQVVYPANISTLRRRSSMTVNIGVATSIGAEKATFPGQHCRL